MQGSGQAQLPLAPQLSAHRAYDVRDVGDGGAGGCPEVEHLGPRLDVDLVDTAQDCCCQLGAEGVPGSILDFVISFLSQEGRGQNQCWVLVQDTIPCNPRALKRNGTFQSLWKNQM